MNHHSILLQIKNVHLWLVENSFIHQKEFPIVRIKMADIFKHGCSRWTEHCSHGQSINRSISKSQCAHQIGAKKKKNECWIPHLWIPNSPELKLWMQQDAQSSKKHSICKKRVLAGLMAATPRGRRRRRRRRARWRTRRSRRAAAAEGSWWAMAVGLRINAPGCPMLSCSILFFLSVFLKNDHVGMAEIIKLFFYVSSLQCTDILSTSSVSYYMSFEFFLVKLC